MKRDLALLILRVVFGFRLIYGTIDNIVSWDRMLEFRDFLDGNGFPIPLIAAVISVYAQFPGGVCWIVGFRLRTASIIMMANFIVAIVGVHILHGDNYIGTAPAIHILAVSIILVLMGGGKFMLGRNN